MHGTIDEEEKIEKSVALPVVSLAVTTGLAAGAKLRENRMCSIIPGMGLQFLGKPNLEQWRELGALIQSAKTTYHLAIADWIAYGRADFGDEVVENTMNQLEFNLSDAKGSVLLSEMAKGARDPFLKYEHYVILCSQLNPQGRKLTADEQEHWSQVAVTQEMSPTMLKLSIATGKVCETITDRHDGRNSGIANLPGMRQNFDIWVSHSEPITEWTLDFKRQVWEELSAPTRLGLKLAHELGINLEEGK